MKENNYMGAANDLQEEDTQMRRMVHGKRFRGEILGRLMISTVVVIIALVEIATVQSAQAQAAANPKFEVLYSFTGGSDGGSPAAGVVVDAVGNVYGTAEFGGAYPCFGIGCGTVFKVDKSGHETTLYSFTGGTDAGCPNNTLLRDTKGDLYGTTWGNCVGNNSGTVFEISESSHYKLLYNFPGGIAGLGFPDGGSLVADGHGDLYGVTNFESCTHNCGPDGGYGAVYKLTKSGEATTLYPFTGHMNGGSPLGTGVIQDGSGNWYGETANGGQPNCDQFQGGCGLVFKLDANWKETVLYRFTGLLDGAIPSGSIALDADGTLYGSTVFGGAGNPNLTFGGWGVVFKIEKNGKFHILHLFSPSESDGGTPVGGVILDNAGNLYGTTEFGGVYALGTVFKLSPKGKFTLLHAFSGQDGAVPTGVLTLDAAGTLYGTASQGGTSNAGVVFKLTP